MIQRTDPRQAPREWPRCPCFTSWHRPKRQAAVCLWHIWCFFMITYYRALSDINYVDFMRRASCKVYQSVLG